MKNERRTKKTAILLAIVIIAGILVYIMSVNEERKIYEGGIQVEPSSNMSYKGEDGKNYAINTSLIREDKFSKVRFPVSEDSIDSFKKELQNKNKTDPGYRPLQTPYDARFPLMFTEGFSIRKDDSSLNFTGVGVRQAVASISGNDALIYNEAWVSTDVELKALSNGIKETFILKDSAAPLFFEFELSGGIKEALETDRLKILPAVFKDPTGDTRKVKQDVIKKDGKTYFKLSEDLSGCVYPVKIEQTIEIKMQ